MNENLTKSSCTYDSIEDIISIIRQKVPLSCVMRNDNDYYAIVKGDTDAKLNAVPMILNYKHNIKSLSMVFHSVHIDISITDLNLNT